MTPTRGCTDDRLPGAVTGVRSASGQELDRAVQRGQVRVVVLGDLPAGTLGQDLDEAEEVQ